jgi:PKD repeat protein
VADPAGHRVTQSITTTVLPPLPQASFTYSVGYSGYVYLDASNSSADPSTSLTGYHWDFGDGSNETIGYPQESHSYASTGSYQITLIVYDATGQASSAAVATIVI